MGVFHALMAVILHHATQITGARLTPQEEQEQASQEPAQLQVEQVLQIMAWSARLNHHHW